MKKVLIITYYWPPSGGPGVQRILKFAKYLPELGWEPVILTVENGNYPSIDKTLFNEIRGGIRVYKTKSFEPFELYKSFTGKSNDQKIPTFVLNKSEKESIVEKFSRWMRANVFVPDAKIGWVKYIVKEGMQIIEKENPDLIFSSSPPHSLQIGAMKLAKKSGLKWVADFRDPWSNAFWQKDINRLGFASVKDNKYENNVLSNADAVTTVSKTIAENFNKIIENNYTVIPNGFDESDFNFEKHNSDKFIISYTGTLGESQKVGNLVNTINGLDKEIKAHIELNFYGTFHPAILNKLQECKNVNVFENVPHNEVVKIMAASQMLLLVIPDSPNNEGILTGKIFEYMATRNYILGIGPVNGDAAEILIKSGTGNMFGYNDSLTDAITDQFNKWKSGHKNSVNEQELSKYTRRNLTAKLVEVFGSML